ncbi:MAG: helix-turn-helix transcriptional regulator [Elusimicrobiales bacterium]|nr:helix-turn-helix transcriptional regulator [Elusimicrobiales bacterium]
MKESYRPLYKNLTELVSKTRSKHKLSLRAFARKLGMTAVFIYDVEKGYRNPTMRLMARLAYAFKIKPKSVIKEFQDIVEIIFLEEQNIAKTMFMEEYENAKE